MSYLRAPEQVVGDLGDTILRQGLRAGDALPRERQLARSLGVSRSRVRAALETLESLGLVETRAEGHRVVGGRGSFALSSLVRLRMSLAGFGMRDLMQVRVQLETCAARRAAVEASPENLAHLRDLLIAMREPEISRHRFQELDGQFHTAITEASANALTARLMRALHDAFTAARTAACAPIVDWARTVGQLDHEHQCILTALENGAGERAAERVSSHIENFYTAA